MSLDLGKLDAIPLGTKLCRFYTDFNRGKEVFFMDQVKLDHVSITGIYYGTLGGSRAYVNTKDYYNGWFLTYAI